MNFNQLDNLVPLDLISKIFELMEQHSFPKNHLLHEKGTVCKHIYLIHKGLARTFFYKHGKDITVHLASEGEVITAVDSIISLKKSRYNVELLEDSEVLSISYKTLQDLLSQYPEYEKYVRLVLERMYTEGADRIEEFLFYSAKERYENLIRTRPQLIQRVNLGHIASYLGMTQETLSRIRKMP
ncbi:Crp/Fnr family transcriptional regulator [Flagellimonas allohymeniacidonis]|uniref:Crp/Fnr family transcriptional regulator n=1 Tax=Flagellimonas allohymeniacidonis TaxID=2517819 RepID=A0A4V6MM93_9FLAO|nr:Crp/Fnr family transcriptional regulator [Allomuricauda hymeniacidonis]TAI47000.1 Crp/Fnr family transcriptional regulator [Allomuricauda hymeniacidonis]